ncbi:MAG: DNA-binding response regulator [Candidatus Nitrospira kreftii]|jgi:RNA polymerase sigma factor (sigma-70 family)|uniref:DNA-binding response regulator n=1 Tax=Candidatus Nitrospira kreftii TaxID=2652173 RepID=A0A7S8FG24_9BACT|nr:MAG: DNA-binding response regulator [Candidatus Nitrospira kreftii]
MHEAMAIKKPRLLMADDHSIMLAGLRKLVEGTCEVIGAVEDGRALVEAAEQLRPDLILVDISMPLLNGMDAARQIKKSVPDVKLIFLTMHASPVFATEALQAGASGYLLKQSAASELPQAIETVLNGQVYLTPAITRPVLDSIVKHKSTPMQLRKSLTQLTPRQREVLQLLAEGKSPKDIAQLLNVSLKTVEFHKTRLMEQLDLHSTLALAKYAIAEGLVSADTGLS